jgi:hypothetical protein
MRTVLIAVDRVEHETDLALLLVIDGEEVWCPKSVVEDVDEVSKGDEDVELNIAEWWCEREGLA